MPRATLAVTLPDGPWITDVSKQYPEATFRVLAAMPAGETGVGLLELTHDDPASVIAAMESHETIISVDLLEAGDGRALIQFETRKALLLFSVRDAGLPLEPPIDITDGIARLEVRGSRDRLSALSEQFEMFGISFTVERLVEDVELSSLLTEQQRRTIVTAVEMGYYDTPRGCSLTEVAEAMGVAKSTCSETLHRAESSIVREFAREIPELDLD
ncbi:MAG: helix-turn-helix domain-containing protein [Halobacteriales archaeon]|nr:helix-turn-helix domain-containing protein [Halobacteriales archaeon]